jgi:hypothetical protein
MRLNTTKLNTLSVLWALTAASGCGGRADGGAGPALRQVAQVTLQEDSALYVARPGGLAVDAQGHFLLSDFFQKWIVEFDGLGRPVGRYGGPGLGPGEFNAIGETVLAVDSLIGAADYRSRTFHFFDRGSRRFVGSRRVNGTPSTGKVVDGTVWLTNFNTETRLGMSVWPLSGERIDERSADLPPVEANLVPLPAEYLEAEPLRGTYPLAHAAPWADSALVGFAAARDLVLVRRDGAVLDSVRIPAVRRRGIPDGLVQELNRPRFDPRKLFASLSGLYGLSRTADGHFVAVHIDPELHGGNRITGRLFVSLLSPDRRRACVDREIPVSDVSQPIVAVRGDSVFVVEQHVKGEAGAATTVTAYRVSPEGCDWIPTDGARGTR